MLQRLLAERFHVRLHRENKTLPVYQLVVAKGGPKLTPAESLAEYKDAREQASALKQQARAGLAANAGTGMNGFQLFRTTLTELARSLSSYVERPVVDHTRLGGYYLVSLMWVPDRPRPAGDFAPGPSIFAAVAEQLGLKLQPSKADFQMLVIDNAERTPETN